MAQIRSEADTAARLCTWLLEMGFPRSPSRDHLLTMCRGNYRYIWECLMKNVQPRNEVRARRLQVFIADINHSRSFEDDIHERITAAVTCEHLQVWRETQALRESVAQAEARVSAAKHELNILRNVVVEKVSQRENINDNIRKIRRKSCALNAITEQLQTRAEKLSEMTRITDQLAPENFVSSGNVKAVDIIEKCIVLLNGLSNKKIAEVNNPETVSGSENKLNSTAMSNLSIASDTERRDQESSVEIQDKLIELLEGINIVDLWQILHNKQDKLIGLMLNAPDPLFSANNEYSSQSVVAETSALHCKIALHTIEMKQRTVALKKILVDVMKRVVHEEEDEAARELLVLQCEEASLRGRVNVLHDQLAAIKQNTGMYQFRQVEGEGNVDSIASDISSINCDIAVKKSHIEKLLMLSDHTGAKIANAVSQLNTLLPQSHADVTVGKYHDVSMQGNYDEFVRHFRPNVPDTSSVHRLLQLKDFYSVQQTQCRDLSLSLECSTDADKSNNYLPLLVDELKYFINKFDLNANRKLVLPSGESLWIVESLEHNHKSRLYFATREIVLGSLRVQILKGLKKQHETDIRMREALGWTDVNHLDVNPMQQNYSEKLEAMLKLSRNSLVSLKQISTQLGMSLNNLNWWETFRPDRFVRECRQVSGKSYNYYHSIFEECTKNKADSLS